MYTMERFFSIYEVRWYYLKIDWKVKNVYYVLKLPIWLKNKKGIADKTYKGDEIE